MLLRHEVVIKHPGMVKLYGYCCEGQHLGVVYEFKPFDSVFNLITKGIGYLSLYKIPYLIPNSMIGLAIILPPIQGDRLHSWFIC